MFIDWLITAGFFIGALICVRLVLGEYKKRLVADRNHEFYGFIVFNKGEDTWFSGALGMLSLVLLTLFIVSLIGKIPGFPIALRLSFMILLSIGVIVSYFSGPSKALQLVSSEPLESAVLIFFGRRQKVIFQQGIVLLPLPFGLMSLKKYDITDRIIRIVVKSSKEKTEARVSEQPVSPEASEQTKKITENIVPEMEPILTKDGVRVTIEVGFVYQVVNPYNALNVDQFILRTQILPQIFLKALRDNVAEHDADWVRCNRNYLQRAIQNLFEEEQINEKGEIIKDSQGNPQPGELVDCEARYGLQVRGVFIGDVSFDNEIEEALQKKYKERKETEAEEVEQDFIGRQIIKHKRRGLTPKEAADLVKVERGKATETIFNIPGLKEGLTGLGEGIGKIGGFHITSKTIKKIIEELKKETKEGDK